MWFQCCSYSQSWSRRLWSGVSQTTSNKVKKFFYILTQFSLPLHTHIHNTLKMLTKVPQNSAYLTMYSSFTVFFKIVVVTHEIHFSLKYSSIYLFYSHPQPQSLPAPPLPLTPFFYYILSGLVIYLDPSPLWSIQPWSNTIKILLTSLQMTAPIS